MWRILLVITGVIMSFQLIGGDTTNTSAIVNQVNQNIAQLKVQDLTKIFKDDTGTRRVLLGKGKNDFYGMKVSQENIDVYDATDSQLVFNSSQNILKIVQTDTVELMLPAGLSPGDSVSVEIPHTLGVVPAFQLYVTPPLRDGYRLTPFMPFDSAGQLMLVAEGITDADNLTISIDIENIYLGRDGSYSFKYYLFQETAN